MSINDLAAKYPHGYVEVVADGVKTYATLLNELKALISISRVRPTSTYEEISTNGSVEVFKVAGYSTSLIDVCSNKGASATTVELHIRRISNDSGGVSFVIANGVTRTVISTDVVTSGVKLRFAY